VFQNSRTCVANRLNTNLFSRNILSILRRSARGSPARASNSQRGTFEHVKKPTGFGSPRGCLHTRQAQGRGRYPFRESCRARPPREASSQCAYTALDSSYLGGSEFKPQLETSHHNRCFTCIFLVPPAISGIVTQIRPRPLPFSSIHYSVTILPLDAIRSDLPRAPLILIWPI
jgi:hypothetical protein